MTKNVINPKKKITLVKRILGLMRQARTLALAALAVLTLLVSSNFGYCAAELYVTTGEVPSDQETYPPVITITSPVNNTAYNVTRLALAFNVNAPQSRTASYTAVIGVTYEADWKKEPISVLNSGQAQASLTLWLSNIPEGQHRILIKAVGYGQYPDPDYQPLDTFSFCKEFHIRSEATICFTADQAAPTVSVLPLENVSANSVIPLNFTVNEAYSKIVYSLDGQQNVTVSGNSTIPPLSAGQHNVTFNVWDIAGNVGTSETGNFTVTEIPKNPETSGPSLFLPIETAVSAAVVAAVVLLLRRRSILLKKKSMESN